MAHQQMGKAGPLLLLLTKDADIIIFPGLQLFENQIRVWFLISHSMERANSLLYTKGHTIVNRMLISIRLMKMFKKQKGPGCAGPFCYLPQIVY